MTVSSRGLIAYRDTIQTRSLPRGNLPPDDACVRSGLEPVLVSIQATARHALPSPLPIASSCQLWPWQDTLKGLPCVFGILFSLTRPTLNYLWRKV